MHQGPSYSIWTTTVDPKEKSVESLKVSLFLVHAFCLDFKASQYSSSSLMFIGSLKICGNSALMDLLNSIVAGLVTQHLPRLTLFKAKHNEHHY